MPRWSVQERAAIVELYIANKYSAAAAQRAFEAKFKVSAAPSKHVIKRSLDNFRFTGNVCEGRHSGRPRSVRTKEMTEYVRQCVAENSQKSLRCLSQEMSISKSSLQRILANDIGRLPPPSQVTSNEGKGTGESCMLVNWEGASNCVQMG